MRIINITNARADLYHLISEDEWKNIEETLFLSSIPGYVENLNDIKNNENWDKAKKYNKDEEW